MVSVSIVPDAESLIGNENLSPLELRTQGWISVLHGDGTMSVPKGG